MICTLAYNVIDLYITCNTYNKSMGILFNRYIYITCNTCNKFIRLLRKSSIFFM